MFVHIVKIGKKLNFLVFNESYEYDGERLDQAHNNTVIKCYLLIKNSAYLVIS